MSGHVSVAGLLLTADEWEALEPAVRAELLGGEEPGVGDAEPWIATGPHFVPPGRGQALPLARRGAR